MKIIKWLTILFVTIVIIGFTSLMVYFYFNPAAGADARIDDKFRHNTQISWLFLATFPQKTIVN